LGWSPKLIQLAGFKGEHHAGTRQPHTPTTPHKAQATPTPIPRPARPLVPLQAESQRAMLRLHDEVAYKEGLKWQERMAAVEQVRPGSRWRPRSARACRCGA
jgi:hypothetical protein